MPTPLYDQLKRLAEENPLRLDMPGHHGRPLPVENFWPSHLDFTENGRTGDLYGEGGDAIEMSEGLWAKRLGFDCCLFLTGGSTQGIHTGLALLAGLEGHVALDRGSHRSAYNALALLGLTPYYLPRPWLDGAGVTGPICPDDVGRLLKNQPKIKTICITAPTYYGVLSDIPAIAEICHAHGARLMVDGAHGAHLPFLGYEGYKAADVVVMSAHKTLPAPGQAALLFANGLSPEELRRMGSVYGTSSPSYVMMAALDGVRSYMEKEGGRRCTSLCPAIEELRKKYSAGREISADTDPLRLTVPCQDGFALAERLRERGVFPEMADSGHVVFIFTCADDGNDVKRLEETLDLLGVEGFRPCPPPPEWPETALSPREALFAPREEGELWESEGRIAACQVAPYPPGVPVIAPGERIQKKHLAYLKEIGYNHKTIFVTARNESGSPHGGAG